MKLVLIFITIIISLNAFTQDKPEADANDSKFKAVTSDEIYGYVNGIRLDSIKSTYAEFNWRSSNRVVIDYGPTNRKSEHFVTDNEGKPLSFPSTSDVFLLNFFHYNHWDLSQAFATSNFIEWILKKQDVNKP